MGLPSRMVKSRELIIWINEKWYTKYPRIWDGQPWTWNCYGWWGDWIKQVCEKQELGQWRSLERPGCDSNCEHYSGYSAGGSVVDEWWFISIWSDSVVGETWFISTMNDGLSASADGLSLCWWFSCWSCLEKWSRPRVSAEPCWTTFRTSHWKRFFVVEGPQIPQFIIMLISGCWHHRSKTSHQGVRLARLLRPHRLLTRNERVQKRNEPFLKYVSAGNTHMGIEHNFMLGIYEYNEGWLKPHAPA